MTRIEDRLVEIVGPQHVLVDADLKAPYETDWTRRFSGEARCVVRPANTAEEPSSSSMRSSWLYLQIRSVRLAEPVLICPADVPTARSAIVESSVSPDRCEMIVA